MTDSVNIAPEDAAQAPTELPKPSADDLRRNPRLALLLKSVAWFCGVVGFFFPGVMTAILNVRDLPDWVLLLTVVFIGIAVVAGVRGSYYNKAPREVRFQMALDLAKNNLAATNRLITRLHEEFTEQTRVFEAVKTKINDLKRAEKYSSEDAPGLVRLITDELREADRRDDRRRWARDLLLLVAGFVLGVVGNWIASPLLTMFS